MRHLRASIKPMPGFPDYGCPHCHAQGLVLAYSDRGGYLLPYHADGRLHRCRLPARFVHHALPLSERRRDTQ